MYYTFYIIKIKKMMLKKGHIFNNILLFSYFRTNNRIFSENQGYFISFDF